MSYIKHRADESLEDACRVEHDLSEESFEAIKKAYSQEYHPKTS